jgi:hypothetical protein
MAPLTSCQPIAVKTRMTLSSAGSRAPVRHIADTESGKSKFEISAGVFGLRSRILRRGS